jgi:hypothetical protein
MYALERNAGKYIDRDRRTTRIQHIEYDYLAPDTINEIFDSLKILNQIVPNEKGVATIKGWENSRRDIEIIKVPSSIQLFKELIQYHGMMQIVDFIEKNKIDSFESLKKALKAGTSRTRWINVGGQLMQEEDVQKILQQIKSGKIKSWYALHDEYIRIGKCYENDKLKHAYTSLLEILNISSRQFNASRFKDLLSKTIATREWMCKGIYDSRAKDYSNPFRKMVYDTTEEMNKVLGKLEENIFIHQQNAKLEKIKKQFKAIERKMK